MTRRFWRSTFAFAALFMLNSACGDITITGPGSGRARDCRISYYDFPTQGTLTVEKPARCPISVPGPAWPIAYAATGSFPVGSLWLPNAMMHVTNAIGQIWTYSAVQNWTTQNHMHRLEMSTVYNAGTAGGYDSADTVYTSIQKSDMTYAVAKVDASYRMYQPAIQLDGPGSVLPQTPYHVDAVIHDPAFMGAVTYDWYLNGQLRTSGSTSRFVNNFGGMPAEEHTIDVYVSDNYGNMRSQQHRILI